MKKLKSSLTGQGVLSVLLPVIAWTLLGYTTRSVWGSNPRAALLILISGVLLYWAGYLNGSFWGRQEERLARSFEALRKGLAVTSN